MHQYIENVLESLNTQFPSYSKEAEKVITDFNFSTGEIHIEIPNWITETLQNSPKLKLGYVNPQGTIELRNRYLEFLEKFLKKSKLSPENVLVTNGAKEAAWLAFMYLSNPNEKILLPTPGWGPYSIWANSLGLKVNYYNTLAINLREEIIRKIRETNSKIIVLNFPNNPTGRTISAEDLNAVSEVSKATGTKIISDEVYRFFDHEKTSILDRKDDLSQLACIDSVSKFLGLAGIRIGFLVADSRMIKDLTYLRGTYASCCNSLSQQWVGNLFEHRELMRWINKIHLNSMQNARKLSLFLEKNGFSIISKGALYIWLEGAANTEILTIENKVISVSPGVNFGSDTGFRICVSREEELIDLFINDNDCHDRSCTDFHC